MFDKNENLCCCAFSIIAALVVAIAFATTFGLGGILFILPLVFLTLGLAVLASILILILIFCKNQKDNIKCIKNSCIIPATIGAFITSITALTVVLLPIVTALLIGAVAFFFVTTLFSIINLLFCLKEKEKDHDCCR